jgi:hypothetical protein
MNAAVTAGQNVSQKWNKKSPILFNAAYLEMVMIVTPASDMDLQRPSSTSIDTASVHSSCAPTKHRHNHSPIDYVPSHPYIVLRLPGKL